MIPQRAARWEPREHPALPAPHAIDAATGDVVSKKAKSEAKKRRRAQKSARKSAQQALYESRKQAGQNTKSKRAKLRSKRQATGRNERHRLGPCQSVGCPRCNPIEANLLPPSEYHRRRGR